MSSNIASTATSLPVIPVILGVVAVASWMGALIVTTKAISSGYTGNSWPSIRGQVTKVISSAMVGMFILLVASIIYFLQDQTKSIYIIFILITFATVLSYSALATSSTS